MDDQDDDDLDDEDTLPVVQEPPSKKGKGKGKDELRYYQEAGAARKHNREADLGLAELEKEITLRTFTKKEISMMTLDEKLGNVLMRMSK